MQHWIMLLIVSAAAIYLARNFVLALRNFLKGDGGCASGCGKCGFAPKDSVNRKSSAPSRRPDIIPLTDIRTLPTRRHE